MNNRKNPSHYSGGLTSVHSLSRRPVKAKSSAITTKDVLTISLSVFALLISALGFYFGNLRVDDHLQSRVASVGILGKHEFPDGSRYLIARTVFANAGNRPALVLGAKYYVSSDAEQAGISFGDECEYSTNTFPLIIPPRDIRLVDLRVPVQHLVDNLASGKKIEPPWSPSTNTAAFHWAMEFFAVDSQGHDYRIRTRTFATILVDQQGAVGLQFSNTNKTATTLFRRTSLF